MPEQGNLAEQIRTGVLCYLHLWAALHKHVQLSHEEIAQGIGLWDDHGGGYFAAFTLDNKRMMQVGQTYVCALGEDGPMVGQMEKIPPCTPLTIDTKPIMLLNALAQMGPGQATDKTMQQVDAITALIAVEQNERGGRRKQSTH